ncbi:UV-B-induced protein At3g17800, chloroplastic-like [Cynara cardunculus var. scolymus]|nr:UV-B-induced protein At3g17800, chloroplastic-like [Cynara cardunculus var. scolymus]
MEYCLPSSFNLHNRLIIVSRSLPSPLSNHRRLQAFSGFSGVKRGRSTVVVASATNYGGFGTGGGSYCEFSSLNTPIQPGTPEGRFLSSVLLNERKSFHEAVAETLEKVVVELDEAYARRIASAESSEACLHRRISEVKGRECKNAIEDIMYLLILYKFSEVKVHLIPRLSKCVYNGRLEILPAKDWELESIHSFEVLEMVREHLTSVIGWRADFSVTDNWATTKIKRADLCQIYTASILFGYFLKSATLRHQLEMSLANPIDDMFLNSGNHLPLPELYKFRRRNLVFGHTHTHNTVSTSPFDGKRKQEKLSSYLMGFAPDSLATCAEPNSMEALRLITKHSFALFGDVESDEIISTSFATLKRFVLEAIAFGSFLWDTEEYVKTVYHLEENKNK